VLRGPRGSASLPAETTLDRKMCVTGSCSRVVSSNLHLYACESAHIGQLQSTS
jgi:hypothetical protein